MFSLTIKSIQEAAYLCLVTSESTRRYRNEVKTHCFAIVSFCERMTGIVSNTNNALMYQLMALLEARHQEQGRVLGARGGAPRAPTRGSRRRQARKSKPTN